MTDETRDSLDERAPVGAVRFAELDDAWRLADMHAAPHQRGLPRVARSGLPRPAVPAGRALAATPSRSWREENGRIVAFCAAAENVGRLYREFMVRDGLAAGVRSAPRLVRSLPHVVETLRYPAATGELPDAEILAVVTDPDVASKGWGSLVLHETLAELERRGCASAKVVAGASNAVGVTPLRAVRLRTVAADLDSRRRAIGSAGVGSVVAFGVALIRRARC